MDLGLESAGCYVLESLGEQSVFRKGLFLTKESLCEGAGASEGFFEMPS